MFQIMNIASKDFNLLYLFTVLYEERNLSKASARMHLSQPALSHKLNKLRGEFDDALFVRTGRGLTPTPKADQMAKEVCCLVKSLESFYQQSENQDFLNKADVVHIFTTDFIELLLLPELIERVRQQAPKVKIVTRNTAGQLPLKALEQGDCDLAIAGFYKELPQHFYRQSLVNFAFWVLHDKSHPDCADGLSLETFTASQHVVTTLSGDLHGVVDRKLTDMGLSRDVVSGASSFLVLPHVIRHTNMLLTCLKPVARHAVQLCSDLTCKPPPIELPEVTIEQIWHPRTQEDPLRRWVRQQVKEILSLKAAELI